jgi:uncharacterized protein YabE (DUF348 family)
MRRIIRKSTTLWGVGVAVLSLLAIMSFGMINSRADALDGSGRLITIHDRGQETVVLSDAETIGEVLESAGVVLDQHDAVEPAVSEKMVATEYSINIYRARPVTVVDGPTRQKIVTPYQTAEQITDDTGIRLFPEDLTTLSRSSDLLADGAGLTLTIDRATEFQLTLYGKQTVARTQGVTVGEMLEQKGITLGQNDRVSPGADTDLSPKLAVQVWREGRQTITAEEPVVFEVQQIRDANQETGYKAIQTPGVDGKKNVTYEIEIRDGKEVNRTEIAALVTQQPTTQVEVIGTKSRILPYSGGGTKTEWLSASNVPSESWGYADYMVQKESSWNPNAVNRSSGACGLAQALPCSKVPGNPHDPVNSLNWMNNYVNGRYGGWEGAYSFWLANRWY